MSKVIAALAAIGWLVQQRVSLPGNAGGLAELRHCAPQHWPVAAVGTAAASEAMQGALDALCGIRQRRLRSSWADTKRAGSRTGPKCRIC
jgi:hypothetical protein